MFGRSALSKSLKSPTTTSVTTRQFASQKPQPLTLQYLPPRSTPKPASSPKASTRTPAPASPAPTATPPPTTTTSSSSPSGTFKFRLLVLTGAVALTVIVGAITGAQLKQDRDTVRYAQEARETPIEEQIATLEERRASLVALKMPLERKLQNLRARMAEEAAAKAAEAEKSEEGRS